MEGWDRSNLLQIGEGKITAALVTKLPKEQGGGGNHKILIATRLLQLKIRRRGRPQLNVDA